MQWIKEVELVDTVDELRSSSSVRGIQMQNLEVLDARIASLLNKIIHNSQFKRKISLEEQKAQKQDRFLRGRQIVYLIYDHFRVTGSHDSVENYTDLFTIVLRNDDIQEFDSKWDGILLSMTEIPHDDILEGLYKFRIRESEKLKTVLELYDLDWIKEVKMFDSVNDLSLRHLEKEFLIPSMTFGIANAFDIFCRLDCDDTLDEVSQNNKQKVASGLFLVKLRAQDFAGLLSSRAPRVLGPISRHRIADILPHIERVSSSSASTASSIDDFSERNM